MCVLDLRLKGTVCITSFFKRNSDVRTRTRCDVDWAATPSLHRSTDHTAGDASPCSGCSIAWLTQTVVDVGWPQLLLLSMVLLPVLLLLLALLQRSWEHAHLLDPLLPELSCKWSLEGRGNFLKTGQKDARFYWIVEIDKQGKLIRRR